MALIIIIIVFFGGIVVLTKITTKWNNPYKLIFLFGKKGSGKSTLLVRYMTEYHKKGYSVYTTMDECTLPYVGHITIDELGEYVAKPKSLICLDEVGIDFDARKFKTFKDSWRDYFKYQRHYKNVVIMASQSWDVDLKIRSLTDKFYLCGKVGPFSYAREIERRIVLTEPTGDSESRIADQLRFKPMSAKVTYIPRYAKHFASFSPPPRPFFIEPPVVPEIKKRRSLRKGGRPAGARRKPEGGFFVGKSLRERLFHKNP